MSGTVFPADAGGAQLQVIAENPTSGAASSRHRTGCVDHAGLCKKGESRPSQIQQPRTRRSVRSEPSTLDREDDIIRDLAILPDEGEILRAIRR